MDKIIIYQIKKNTTWMDLEWILLIKQNRNMLNREIWSIDFKKVCFNKKTVNVNKKIVIFWKVSNKNKIIMKSKVYYINLFKRIKVQKNKLKILILKNNWWIILLIILALPLMILA